MKASARFVRVWPEVTIEECYRYSARVRETTIVQFRHSGEGAVLILQAFRFFPQADGGQDARDSGLRPVGQHDLRYLKDAGALRAGVEALTGYLYLVPRWSRKRIGNTGVQFGPGLTGGSYPIHVPLEGMYERVEQNAVQVDRLRYDVQDLPYLDLRVRARLDEDYRHESGFQDHQVLRLEISLVSQRRLKNPPRLRELTLDWGFEQLWGIPFWDLKLMKSAFGLDYVPSRGVLRWTDLGFVEESASDGSWVYRSPKDLGLWISEPCRMVSTIELTGNATLELDETLLSNLGVSLFDATGAQVFRDLEEENLTEEASPLGYHGAARASGPVRRKSVIEMDFSVDLAGVRRRRPSFVERQLSFSGVIPSPKRFEDINHAFYDVGIKILGQQTQLRDVVTVEDCERGFRDKRVEFTAKLSGEEVDGGEILISGEQGEVERRLLLEGGGFVNARVQSGSIEMAIRARHASHAALNELFNRLQLLLIERLEKFKVV